MYPKEFRIETGRRVALNPALTLGLAKELGVTPETIRHWRRQYQGKDMAKSKDGQWSAEDKFRAVMETIKMGEADLGAYCRQHGIYTHQLDLWREQCIAPLRKGRKTDPEMKQILNENQRLKKELNRKEKALAEAAALLMLKKKVEALWGGPDDEES
jgi:transposase